MANLLKKIQIGNPLYNLEMMKELRAYNAAKNDEELAKVYHKLLDIAEERNSDVLRNLVYAMIAFSTNVNINPLVMMLWSWKSNQ